MKVVAFLTEPAVVDRIIDHLKLTFYAEKPPPKIAVRDLLMAADPPAEYFRILRATEAEVRAVFG